ncbi:unnamed protein product [Blepharisma stoltei]|uniref:Cyclic nucleotide-binding domain-containing protein n=1 Tax=Blepharisma stoltei TaxID=1481888 RepID=A0AAU9J6U2_9CILI|nr:unnamed protein product [Blepharisma stoltei]
MKLLDVLQARSTKRASTHPPSADATQADLDMPPAPSSTFMCSPKNALHIIIPSKNVEDDNDLSSTERLKREIRNTPVINSKYLPIWQRMRVKIKTNLRMKSLRSEIKLYGTNTAVMNELKLDHKSFIENKDKKNDLLREMTGISSRPDVGFFIILPTSKFKIYWNIVLIFLLIYTATLMPYNLAFGTDVKYNAWWWIDLWINILFGIDVYINSVSAYYNSESMLILDHCTIFYHYLRTWMIFDLIACFPFNLVMDDNSGSSATSGNYNNLGKLARIPRLYRLFRISRLFKMLKYYRNSEFMEKMQEFLSLKNSVMRLMSFFTAVAICIHVMSCIWYFSAKLQGFSPETWVVRGGYQDLDNSTLYLLSVYWAFTTLTTVGYGDIHAFTDFEKMLAICWMIFGVCFFSVTIGSLSSMLSGIDTKESMLSTKLAIIDEFAKESKLSKEFKIRLRHALKYSTEKSGFSWDDKQDILNELPKNLRYEVALAMHRGAAKKIPFFSERDIVFVASIVPFLKHMLVENQSFVYLEGEFSDEIYFIAKGRVCYTFGPKNTGFRTLLRGSYFGDIEVIEQCSRKYSVKAVGNCHLLVMNKPLIVHISKEFPFIWKEMVKVSKKRDKLNKAGIKQVKELIELQNNGSLSGKPLQDVKKLINNICDEASAEEDSDGSEMNNPTLDGVFQAIGERNKSICEIEENLENMLVSARKLLKAAKEGKHGSLPPIKSRASSLSLIESVIETKSNHFISSADVSEISIDNINIDKTPGAESGVVIFNTKTSENEEEKLIADE